MVLAPLVFPGKAVKKLLRLLRFWRMEPNDNNILGIAYQMKENDINRKTLNRTILNRLTLNIMILHCDLQ